MTIFLSHSQSVLRVALFSMCVLLLAVSAQAKDALNTISAGSTTWSIELADDDDARQTGLMNRKSMAAESGMLFRFERAEPIAMWMKNTFIPLDMVFMDDGGTITHIHYGAVPQSLDIISSRGPVRYVLEINAGEAKAYGLQTGQRMAHPWFAAVK